MPNPSPYASIPYGSHYTGITVAYGDSVPDDAVNLAYVSAPRPPVPDVVQIDDDLTNLSAFHGNSAYVAPAPVTVVKNVVYQAPELPDQSLRFESGVWLVSESVYTPYAAPTDNVLFTSVSKGITNIDGTGEIVPLFYCQMLRHSASASEIPQSWEDAVTVTFSNGDVLPFGYVWTVALQQGNGPIQYLNDALPQIQLGVPVNVIVYTNFRGTYQQSFNVRWFDGFEETLNVHPVYWQGKTTEDSHSYIALPQADSQGRTTGFNFRIASNDNALMWITTDVGPQVYLDQPDNLSTEDNWYLRIHRGWLSQTDPTNQHQYLVGLQPYYHQNFSTYMPIVMANTSLAEVVGAHSVQVSHIPMIVDARYPIDVMLTSRTLSTSSQTTWLTRAGGLSSGAYNPDPIVDVDAARGLITLDDSVALSSSDTVHVTYYYMQYYYPYRGFTDAFGRFIHLDVNPSGGHTWADIWGLDRTNLIQDSDIVVPGTFWDHWTTSNLLIQPGPFAGSNAFVYNGTGLAAGFLWAGSSVIAVEPGTTLTLSGYVDATFVMSGSPQWGIYSPDYAIGYASANQNPGALGRVHTTWTVPNNVTSIRVICDTSNCTVAAGRNLVYTQPQLEAGTSASLYEPNIVSGVGNIGTPTALLTTRSIYMYLTQTGYPFHAVLDPLDDPTSPFLHDTAGAMRGTIYHQIPTIHAFS